MSDNREFIAEARQKCAMSIWSTAVGEWLGDALRPKPEDGDAVIHRVSPMVNHVSAEGIIRRLKRDDHQTELDAIASGEMTPNQAALKVGYRKPRCSVRTDDIQAAIDTLLKHYDLDALRDEINLTGRR